GIGRRTAHAYQLAHSPQLGQQATRMSARVCLLIALLVSLAATAPAVAHEPAPPEPKSLEQRVREVEEIIEQMQTQPSPATAFKPEEIQPPPSHPIPLETGSAPGMYSATGGGKKTSGWDNGFYLRSDDGAYQLRITGQI